VDRRIGSLLGITVAFAIVGAAAAAEPQQRLTVHEAAALPAEGRSPGPRVCPAQRALHKY
jgi:hypothetical protein